MSRKFQCRAIPSIWLEHSGRRLDCGPYMSGAIEARELLSRIDTIPLNQLTEGYNGGIYNGSPFVRNYVEDPNYGVPFLTTSSMLYADLNNLPLLRKTDAHSQRLSFLEIKSGMSLITCSGTIGRMVYGRKDMNGVWSNQDIMKVVPDPTKVKPGYLYSYLTSRFGVPIVISGTYGAIIQHIEPHHIADLPVPRLSSVEDQVHQLVQKAADLRTEASKSMVEAITMMEQGAGIDAMASGSSNGIGFGVSTVNSSDILKRMDACFHSPYHIDVLSLIESAGIGTTTVGEIAASIVEPKRFRRVQIEDEAYGIPMFGTTALMWADPQPSFLIPKRLADEYALMIDSKTILIPRSGQLSGIIGTAVLPYGKLLGGAISEDAIRIHCHNETDAGFLLVALKSEIGRRQLKARAYGSSIPHLDVYQIAKVVVPEVDDDLKKEIGQIGSRSSELRTEAIFLENEARTLVEQAIEQGAH